MKRIAFEFVWLCTASIAITLGVYFAYGVAGAALDQNITTAIIVTTVIAARIVVHFACDRNSGEQ